MTPTVLSQLPRGATVVVIRLRSLGDTVLTTPALALLKQTRPDVRIVVVLEAGYRELLDGNDCVSRVLTYDRSQPLRRLGTLRAIRAEQPALCLNLHGGSTSAWWTAFSGARFRAGFGHFSMQFAYNVRIPRAQTILQRAEHEAVHTAEHHASAMFYLGVPVAKVPRAVLHADPATIESAPIDNVPGEKPYAVFHVTAAYFTKQWAPEQFHETAEFVRDQYGFEPVIIAGAGRGSDLREIQRVAMRGRPSVGRIEGPSGRGRAVRGERLRPGAHRCGLWRTVGGGVRFVELGGVASLANAERGGRDAVGLQAVSGRPLLRI